MMIGCNRCCENVRAIERGSWTRNDVCVCMFLNLFFYLKKYEFFISFDFEEYQVGGRIAHWYK